VAFHGAIYALIYMKNTLLTVLFIALLVPSLTLAKGGRSGGGYSGGRSSFSSSRSYSSTRSVSTRPSVNTTRTTTTAPTKATTVAKTTTAKPTPKVSTKPTSSTAKVVSKPKTVAGKTFKGTGNVVGADYQPKFNGYTAPVGSTVYYRESSALDWLPFYMIMNSSSHREALVTEPAKDGQPAVEKVVKEEGVDTMYVWNWIFSILFTGGIIALIVWFVNKKTK